MKEALKLALDVLERYQVGKWQDFDTFEEAIAAIKAALAQPAQEPDHGDELTIAYMSGVHRGKELAAQPAQEPVALVIDGVLVKSELPEKYTGHLYTTPPAAPVQERNFCQRCGKRTADLTVIHTCTPPQENT